MFVNRSKELAFFASLLERTRPTAAQLVLLYGRRRVGKTVLVRRWAEASGLTHSYFAAEKETAALQRRKLFARILEVPPAQSATFETWADMWAAVTSVFGDRRHILILDEIPYLAEADPAFLSSLQHAWDQQFKTSNLLIVLSGSHVHTMETLLARGSPLFGRFTGQWHLQPLEFAALREFLPGWPAEQRVAAYGIVGGVPAYLEWLDPARSLTDNLREVVLAPGSVFMTEPTLLLYDEIREPRVHLAIVGAIGQGQHSFDEIANAALIGKTHLSAYLARLQELRIIERRLPATVRPRERARSRMGRYHLSDPFFRFYFRFIAPHQDDLAYRPEAVLPGIQEQLRSFIGQTAFEDLCRQWVEAQGQAGQLPFEAEQVGGFWSAETQIDVVAINWSEKRLLLGECKWGLSEVGRDVLRELVEKKAGHVLRALPSTGKGWTVNYAFFARGGFTQSAREWASIHQALLIELSQLDVNLRPREA